MSVVARATRRARSGSRTLTLLPIRTPGIEPISSHPVAWKSTLPAIMWPTPATHRSAAAWKMSVPTTRAAESGKRISIARPKNVPLPTEVSPTMKPPKAPIPIAISLSRVSTGNGAYEFSFPRTNVFTKKPIPPSTSATPRIFPSIVCARAP